MFKKISIIGVGLIGGSIGMAARKKRLASEIIGIGRRASSIKKAINKKAIDKGTLDIKKGLKDADLIIIATPVDKVMPKIKEVIKHVKQGAIIIDVNSAKERVVEFADKIMPKGIFFVGTHPIAGSEESGILPARGSLFEDTICAITPTKRTNKIALNKVMKIWKSLGAHIVLLSPKEHDKAIANISHLPHILSYSLCNTASSKDLSVAGSGFKDTTRIAKSNPAMWADIFIQNKKAILTSIEHFQKELLSLKADIRKGKRKELKGKLDAAKRKRDNIR